MLERTRNYLRQLAEEGEKVMVPATVVQEYLYGFPQEERQQQLEALSANFFLPPLDPRCALMAADIESAGAEYQVPGVPGQRRTLRADSQIIATAVCHGADLIVTNNVEEYRRLAGDRIKISDVPEIPHQGELLDGHD